MTKTKSLIVACAALAAVIGAAVTPAAAMSSVKHSTPAMHQRPMMGMQRPMMHHRMHHRMHRKMMHRAM